MTAYAYHTLRTPLHALGAGKKLVALLGLSLPAFFFGLGGLLVASLAVATVALIARMSPKLLFAGARPLVVMTGTVALLGAVTLSGGKLAFDPQGAYAGGKMFWGVLVAFAAGSILFATTTTAELREALEGTEKKIVAWVRRVLLRLPIPGASPLAERIRPTDLSLIVAMAISFMPRVFSAWEAAEDAYRARCGRGKVFALMKILPLAAERLIEGAVETARALEARGYSRDSR